MFNVTPPSSPAAASNHSASCPDVRYKRSFHQQSQLPYTRRADEIASALALKQLPITICLYNGDKVVVHNCVRKLGSGQYVDAYLVFATANCLHGSALCVLKVPTETAREEKDGIMRSKIITELVQYKALETLFRENQNLAGVRLAKNYTLECYPSGLTKRQVKELMSEPHSRFLAEGCQIQEYVTSLEDYTAGRHDQCMEMARAVKKIFTYFPLNMPLDFQAENVGVDDEGSLCLFDPMHPNDDEFFLSKEMYLRSFENVFNQADMTDALRRKMAAMRAIIQTRVNAALSLSGVR